MSLPALLLGASRASWLAVFLSILPYLSRRQAAIWLIALALFILAMFVAADGHLTSVEQRLILWNYALSDLKLFGNGVFDYSTLQYREPNAHNDYLQLIYSFGIIGLIPVLLSGWCFVERIESRPFIIAFGFIAVFGFPLEMPFTAWLGSFVLGHFLGSASFERGVLPRARLANA